MVEYSPGEENISPRGRQARYLTAVLAGISLIVLLLQGPGQLLTPLSLAAVFVASFGMFYSFYQAEKKFCGTLGLAGLREDTSGDVKQVDDTEARNKDISASLEEIRFSVVFAVLTGIWLFLLAAAA